LFFTRQSFHNHGDGSGHLRKFRKRQRRDKTTPDPASQNLHTFQITYCTQSLLKQGKFASVFA
jgi:hypothetical protein